MVVANYGFCHHRPRVWSGPQELKRQRVGFKAAQVTTAYYDIRPGRREAPHYAEIYLHSGGRYGDFSSFDIVPRREVFLPADPAALLEAINDRAITHLAVPNRTPQQSIFPWKEPEAARDHIRHCFAYSADGRTSRADVAILSRKAELHQDVALALEPIKLAENIERYIDAGDAEVRLYSTRLAKFDFVFEDSLIVGDRYGGSMELDLKNATLSPKLDPVPLLPLMAQETSHIGLISTASTTFYPPYILARPLSTVDSLTGGRAGWNMVTSSEKNAALNFGLEKLLPPTERYDIADEFMFSIDMETGFPRVALISAAWGLGETVVQGRVVRTA